MTERRIAAPAMAGFLTGLFAAAGASAEEAAGIAENLVDANLAGHDSHGIVRAPRYLGNVRDGVMRFGGRCETVIDGGAFLLLDGGFGMGQTVGREATDLGIARARREGVAVVGLRRAGHLGRIGAWAERASAAGLVSIHFVNVARSMLVAPFGGAERRFSTAPVCIGMPCPGGDDFLLDFATSTAAEGKILVAKAKGAPAPAGALIDGAGRPTEDPDALYGETPPGAVPNPRLGAGALTAMGGHKGSGLALACELLAGTLTGSGTAGPGEGPYNGMLSILIDPERFDDGHGFAAAAADYIAFVRGTRPTDPFAPVLIPGDPERRAREERGRLGLPLPEATLAALAAAAREAGAPPLAA